MSVKGKSWTRWPKLAGKGVLYSIGWLVILAIGLVVAVIVLSLLALLARWLGGVVLRGGPQLAEVPGSFFPALFLLLGCVMAFLAATLPIDDYYARREREYNGETVSVDWRRRIQLALVIASGIAAFIVSAQTIESASANRPSAAGLTVLIWLFVLALLAFLMRVFDDDYARDRKEVLTAVTIGVGLSFLTLGWAAWTMNSVGQVALGLMPVVSIPLLAALAADGKMKGHQLAPVASVGVLCAMVVLSASFGEGDRDSRDGTLGRYCSYGAQTKEQLNGCLDNVTSKDISRAYDQQTPAGLHAFEDGNECGYGSGPFCRTTYSIE